MRDTDNSSRQPSGAGAASITQQLADTSLQDPSRPPAAYAGPTSTNNSSSSSMLGVPSRLARLQAQQQLPVLQLVNAPCRVDRPPPTNVVHVTTSDGEWFPVKKALLRPCLQLTQVCREAAHVRNVTPLRQQRCTSPCCSHCSYHGGVHHADGSVLALLMSPDENVLGIQVLV
jgi:hypothetical protein